jgi:hypothetical protein
LEIDKEGQVENRRVEGSKGVLVEIGADVLVSGRSREEGMVV